MKKLFLATVLLLAMTPSKADVLMTLPDNYKQTFGTMGAMVDQCVGAALTRSDTAPCQNLKGILIQLENQPVVKKEDKKEEPSAPPAEPAKK